MNNADVYSLINTLMGVIVFVAIFVILLSRRRPLLWPAYIGVFAIAFNIVQIFTRDSLWPIGTAFCWTVTTTMIFLNRHMDNRRREKEHADAEEDALE